MSRDPADIPEAEARDEMIGRAHAEQSHGCLGCAPCFPVEPFNAFNELLAKDRAQESCCPPASAEAQSVPDLSPSWPPLPGDYTVLDKDAPGAVCTLAELEKQSGGKRSGKLEFKVVNASDPFKREGVGNGN